MAQSHGILVEQKSCLPCMHGDHLVCRDHPNKDGAIWEKDSETGERRLVLRKRGYEGEARGGEERLRPPCQCEAGGHEGAPGTCYAFSLGDWGSYRCGRPVKGTIKLRSSFSQSEIEIEACGIHIAARNRVLVNDKKRENKFAARRELEAADKAAGQASEDWAAKLADEFGLPVEAMKVGSGTIKVELSPEPAYAILDEVRTLLDEVYENHPFKRKSKSDPIRQEGRSRMIDQEEIESRRTR